MARLITIRKHAAGWLVSVDGDDLVIFPDQDEARKIATAMDSNCLIELRDSVGRLAEVIRRPHSYLDQ